MCGPQRPRHDTAGEELGRLPDGQRHAGVDERRVHQLPRPGPLARVERGQDAARGEEAGSQVRQGDAHLHRRAIRLSGHRHQPGHPLGDQIEPALVGGRPGPAVARDRGVDQTWIADAQGRVVEPEPAQHAGAVVLDEHVRFRRQPPQHVGAAGRLQIDDDAALPAVDGIEGGAVVAARPRHPARGIARRRLHLDHVGAHVAQ